MRLRAFLLAAGVVLATATPASAATFTVAAGADGAGTCTGTACTTIRAALTAARNNGVTTADTITLAAGNFQLTQAAGGQLVVDSNVSINGATGATLTKIAGDGKNFRIFDVTGAGRVATIARVHATAATAVNYAAPADQVGGVVLVDAGAALTLDHAWLDGGSAARGGGIAIRGGAATITKSLITGNTAIAGGDAGGILVLGGVSAATLSISDSTVALNSALTAIGIESVSGGAANTVTVTRSTIAYNNTTGGTNSGSGLNNSGGGSFQVGGSLVADNRGDSAQDNCTSGITSAGGNVETSNQCGFTQASDLTDQDNANFQLLAGALSAAGTTQVLVLPAGSSAIDRPGACAGSDQRDLVRPQGSGCDAGAYEVEQAPVTSIDAKPPSPTNDNTPTFNFSSTEPGVTFQCSLRTGAAAYAACTSPITYAAQVDGVYTFSVRALDGTHTGTAATYTFTIDTPPITTVLSGPAGPTNSTGASFTYNANEVNSTFQCKLDGAAAGTYALCPLTGKSYAGLAQGTYTFSVYAVDPGGTPDPTPATQSFTVDTTPPETTIGDGPSGPTNVAAPSFAFSSSEAGSTFQCKLDSGTFAACTSPQGYSGLANGAHTFSVRATDPAKNTSAAVTRSFTLDTTPPAATITDGPAGATTDSAPAFGFTTDPAATVECKLDRPGAPGSFAACASPASFSGLAPGDYTFSVRATDAAGNQTTTSRSFSVAQIAQATPTPSPAPTPAPTPTPVYHQTVVVSPLRGTTLVKLPGAKSFAVLDVTKGIPLGSTVDTRTSEIRLFAIPKPGKPAESALFFGGIFTVTQVGGITQLELVEALARCPSGKATAAAKKPKTRKLWGDGSGSFRTRGQFSAATVRGTRWLVQDSCGKTLTRVARGVVSVQDFVKHKTLVLRAPRSYTARSKH